MNDEISYQIDALRRQVFILLLALIIVSGTLTVFLYRQASLTRRDIAAIKPQATQVIQVFNQNRPAIQNFVQQLVAYGQTHPDFQQMVLKRYGITPQSVAAIKK
jgi:sensor domain CHASE-containing protein